jgi:DNA-directed RNA polymerase alpha subunit
MEDFHNQEIDTLNDSRDKMKVEYQSKIDRMEAEFTAKRIEEFEVYRALKDKMTEMKRGYDKQMDEHLKNKIERISELNLKYESMSIEKSATIEQV